ncbi:hypothetical protein AB9X29_003729 [Vibrio vulnificus]
MAYVGSDASSVTDLACTVFGSVTGTPEGAFECASGFQMASVIKLVGGLFIALYIILYLRLLHRTWQQTQGARARYTFEDLIKLGLPPIGLLAMLLAAFETFI